MFGMTATRESQADGQEDQEGRVEGAHCAWAMKVAVGLVKAG